jgi:DNA-damage-inducible protein D
MQARRQELQSLVQNADNEDEHRLLLRQEMTEHNKSLVAVAHKAGINESEDYSRFYNRGYEGLYGGLNAQEIHARKALKENEKILDFMGSAELAANLFCATQTEAKLVRDKVQGVDEVIKTHHQVGQIIRNTFKKLGATMPEDLPKPEKNIHELEKSAQQLGQPSAKKLKMSK